VAQLRALSRFRETQAVGRGASEQVGPTGQY